MKTLNEELNPTRMTDMVREKIREARRGTGEGKSYRKVYGKHEHRLVAEDILDRPLEPDEVVHHVDLNPLNNNPENIMIFPSQSEHVKWHIENDPRYYVARKREVMPK
jgi:hypothetical protein